MASSGDYETDKFGFIVMDGNETLFGTLSGRSTEVLHRLTVELPKKHGRGGQSASRFARLRMEKRDNYLRETAELATRFFIDPQTGQPNVSGLILAGSPGFNTELSRPDMFDPRLRAKIRNVVAVTYGGDVGLNEAIELCAELLPDVQFIREKKLIGKFFEEIYENRGKHVFGVDDTVTAAKRGDLEVLIVWKDLEITRYVLENSDTGEIVIKHLDKEQEADESNFDHLEIVESMHLLEWFSLESQQSGFPVELVTNMSQEGSQFCRAFGGIGGVLRGQLGIKNLFFDYSDDLNDLSDLNINDI